ncbi:PREDICTED: uncharacterized protein LOC107085444 [Cyprinodon variegatus]|uniref:uncharacterized protein LOC107085444 n=1 Tax=Cyprinodon variegatus TaxID=28743 RepID=UPI0007429860|nr:PREDICTED: uncharacterized protein LOC107085444 [Cyprinodon variegatus]
MEAESSRPVEVAALGRPFGLGMLYDCRRDLLIPDQHIEDFAGRCTACQTVRNAPKPAAVHPWEWPAEPWQRIHIDFAGPFEDRMLLVVVDAHSKWPDVAIMRSTTTRKTIERLEEMFSRYGIPEQLVSDNGPQFVAEEMEAFLKMNGIQHIKSAPYHPSTNGLAERFVQTLKHSLKASVFQGSLHQRLYSFLLTYRNTPHSTTKASPAELLLKRALRTQLDCIRPQSRSQTVLSSQQEQSQRRAGTPRSFHIGDPVLARNYLRGPRWVPAKVVAITGPLSYQVRTNDDLVWRRHTDQLLASKGPAPEPMGSPLQDISDGADAVEDQAAPDTLSTTLQEDNVTDQVPQPPLTTDSAPPSSPVTHHPHRYPTRERRPPDRLNLKTENKFSCKFYGDFILQKTPLTFQEAIQLYQTLPNLLGANGEQAVPLKVWMLPLTILNPSAARMVKQISVGLVQETQRILDDLSLLEVRCNDAIRATADKFPKNRQNLMRFKEMCSDHKLMLQQDLAMKLPLIRGGEFEEDELEKILRKRQSSPFSNQHLNQWMDWKEKEICFLKALMSTMKSTKHLSSPNQLYEEVLRTEEVLCFVFTSVEDDEPFVSALESYMKGEKLDCSADKEREQWLDSIEEVDEMKKKAKLFSDYAEANKERKNMKFLTVALTDDKHKGKCFTIYRYKQGIIETEDYEIPSPNH